MERYVNVEKMIEALKDETCTACIDNRGDDTTYCETRCDFYAFLNDDEEIINDLSREDEKRLIPADCTDVYDLSDEQWKEIIGKLEWKLAIVVNIDTPDGDL